MKKFCFLVKTGVAAILMFTPQLLLSGTTASNVFDKVQFVREKPAYNQDCTFCLYPYDGSDFLPFELEITTNRYIHDQNRQITPSKLQKPTDRENRKFASINSAFLKIAQGVPGSNQTQPDAVVNSSGVSLWLYILTTIILAAVCLFSVFVILVLTREKNQYSKSLPDQRPLPNVRPAMPDKSQLNAQNKALEALQRDLKNLNEVLESAIYTNTATKESMYSQVILQKINQLSSNSSSNGDVQLDLQQIKTRLDEIAAILQQQQQQTKPPPAPPTGKDQDEDW